MDSPFLFHFDDEEHIYLPKLESSSLLYTVLLSFFLSIRIVIISKCIYLMKLLLCPNIVSIKEKSLSKVPYTLHITTTVVYNIRKIISLEINYGITMKKKNKQMWKEWRRFFLKNQITVTDNRENSMPPK